MGGELLKAVVGVAAVLAAWLTVQRVFAASTRPGEDALAGRTGCHDCTCERPCENNDNARTAAQDTN